ncbi:MAG: HEAT repeat domain-containing protein [Nitrospirota bacterium]
MMALQDIREDFDTSFTESVRLLETLHNLQPAERSEALERLLRNPSPDIRGRSFHIGAAFLTDDQLTAYLRNETDDVIRNAGLEILKMRGSRSFSLSLSLLKDTDPDIVLQAIQILDNLRDPRAMEPLRHLLYNRDSNIIQAAIIAIGHLGDQRAMPDLLPFLHSDPWLQMAAVQALGDIRSQQAVRPLAKLLTDLMAGPLAAESLARIGGKTAHRLLVSHWLKFREQLDDEVIIGLLSHVIEGFTKQPPEIPGFRESIAPSLDDILGAVRVSAAKCLLSDGSGPEDKKSLSVLSAVLPEQNILPSCLRRRKDLIPYLLGQSGPLKIWGFHLVSRYPKSVDTALLCRALDGLDLPESLEYVVKALLRVKDPLVAPAVLNLYVRTPGPFRSMLNPLLRTHRSRIRNLLDHSHDIDHETRLVVSALLGAPALRILSGILDHAHDSRIRIISQIRCRTDIMGRIPWNAWLRKEPVTYSPLAAEIAAKTNMRELLPMLRSILISYPHPKIIVALGELKDRDCLPILISHLGKVKPFAKVHILESLGRIGGPAARMALRNATLTLGPKEARIAYKALSGCAVEEDLDFFRNALDHPDWYVRLSCTEVFGRYARPENVAVLAGLAADSNFMVAQRAVSFLAS